MKRKILTCLAMVALCGCARFSTTQTDERDETNTTITTKATSWTLFNANSSLANWKASQTEKSQGATVGSLNQVVEGSNTVSIIRAVAEGAAQGAANALLPKP